MPTNPPMNEGTVSNVQDYKKFAILYVDDEEKSLKSLRAGL